MTVQLYNNDCLEVMRDLSANSIDLLFCDLPYGQTDCKWDVKIDLTLFWKEVNRICKITCPMFFTTTTRFGIDLINSNPKNFRYDLVWVKSKSAGFLLAKKMPMRKHEMIYVFYRKLPLYDLSSHTHKFLEGAYNKETNIQDPPLPNSVIKTELVSNVLSYRNPAGLYDPPLPTSVLEIRGKTKEINNDVYNVDERMINGKLYHYPRQLQKGDESIYEPPLPNSVIKEDGFEYKKSVNEVMYQKNLFVKQYKGRSRQEPVYDPPLPNSILEIKSQKGKHSTQKPTALMEWILKYYSKEGDTILDPTMGSGSTGIACKTMNRNFIGIEKDEAIYKGATERLI